MVNKISQANLKVLNLNHIKFKIAKMLLIIQKGKN